MHDTLGPMIAIIPPLPIVCTCGFSYISVFLISSLLFSGLGVGNSRPDVSIDECAAGSPGRASLCWDKAVIDPRWCRAVAGLGPVKVETGVVDLGPRLPGD
ncbi:MAG: hypothetical protein JW941_11030 [Candidatus Coatesbacteria bacterium]|nr:hypothetical protein [Candidatus Coatesbacteria bacterium]